MRFSIYQDSNRGARAMNQDRMGFCYTRESLLMLVADGMGGHLHGDVASHLAVQAIAACFHVEARPALEDPPAFLDRALRLAHRELLHFALQRGLPETPRTTIVACVVQTGRAWWAHAGDSRLYWIRKARLRARTYDHSKIQNLLDLGQIDEFEAETHPERNKVLNCLGSPFEPVIDLGGDVALCTDDTLMLCTDGVWSAMDEDTLVACLSGAPVPDAVPLVVNEAVVRAGATADNATVLAMNWEGLAPARRLVSANSLARLVPGSTTPPREVSGGEGAGSRIGGLRRRMLRIGAD